MKNLPKTFTKKDIKDLTFLYKNSPKSTILKRFPNYQWNSLNNITGFLHLKRDIDHSKRRNGDISKLLSLSKESCYWLGLIITDGCISKDGTVKVDLQRRDTKYLSGLSKYLGSKLYFYKKYKSNKRNRKGNGIVRVKVKDLIYGLKLRNLFGIKDKKTYEPVSIDFLKNKYQFFCFFIGMVDGDGSIKKGGRGMCIDMHINQYPFLEKLGNILKKYNFISYFTIQTYMKMCRLNIHRRNDLLEIYKLVKKLKLPILKRKWDRIRNMKPPRGPYLMENKSTIKKLRKRGYGYKTITKILNYSSFGTLYTFCKNHNIR